MNIMLRGIELRYVLTMQLSQHGLATIAEVLDALAWHGFSVRGRASKAISDALRWEIACGRVRRLGRGRYGPSYIPRDTSTRAGVAGLGPGTGEVATCVEGATPRCEEMKVLGSALGSP
ncbi:hypothetical protein [Mycobacterium ostraviense]|uniref:hypothetical protein n=1 Tax=Mycobacterium ostraviense TaxID=2738409 RepID=UPI000AD66240|nr:hypothetical protein [Mycobacterium ostraviense]UGT92403.1 hypothetical protein LTS72_02965 [Mycobacterium ostraviense]